MYIIKSYLAYQIMEQHHAPILWVWLMFELAAVVVQPHCVVAIVVVLSGQSDAADCYNNSPIYHMTNHSPHLLIPLLSSNSAQQPHS